MSNYVTGSVPGSRNLAQEQADSRQGLRFVEGIVGAILAFMGIVFYYYGSELVPHVGSQVEFGFWAGVLNGIFVLPTFVISLFNDNWEIYQACNNGNFYTFGFMLGSGLLSVHLVFWFRLVVGLFMRLFR